MNPAVKSAMQNSGGWEEKMTQAEIDLPDGFYFRPDKKPIGTYTPGNGWGCIHNSVIMELRRLAREQGKPVKITVGKVPPVRTEGRVMKGIGKVLLVCGSLYFLIHILIWAVKS